MRKVIQLIVPAILAAGALGSAGAASAQPYGGHQGDHRGEWGQNTPGRATAIRTQIDDLQRRIARNDNRDRISEREARALRQDVRRLQDQFRSFNRNGLDNREMRILENRIQDLRTRLRIERQDRDGRRW